MVYRKNYHGLILIRDPERAYSYYFLQKKQRKKNIKHHRIWRLTFYVSLRDLDQDEDMNMVKRGLRDHNNNFRECTDYNGVRSTSDYVLHYACFSDSQNLSLIHKIVEENPSSVQTMVEVSFIVKNQVNQSVLYIDG